MNEKFNLNDLKNNDFSLVLSGGAALGLSHIGVLKFLEENGLKPKEIIGTSMGSLIGGLWSIGYSSDEISEMIEGFPYPTGMLFFQRRNFAKKVDKFFEEIFKGKKFVDADVSYMCIATDIDTGNSRVFSKKDDLSLKIGILASCSIPTLFPVKRIGKKIYVDGYFSSNLGVEFATSKLILGVDVLAKDKLRNLSELENFSMWKITDIFRLYRRFTHIMIQNRISLKLEKYSNLILIEPNTLGFRSFDYSKLEELVDVGYREIKNCLKIK